MDAAAKERVAHVVQILSATLDADLAIRHLGEQAFTESSCQPGFAYALVLTALCQVQARA